MESNEIFGLVCISIVFHVLISFGINEWIFSKHDQTYASIFLSCCPGINIIFVVFFTIYKICKSLPGTLKNLAK